MTNMSTEGSRKEKRKNKKRTRPVEGAEPRCTLRAVQLALALPPDDLLHPRQRLDEQGARVHYLRDEEQSAQEHRRGQISWPHLWLWALPLPARILVEAPSGPAAPRLLGRDDVC